MAAQLDDFHRNYILIRVDILAKYHLTAGDKLKAAILVKLGGKQKKPGSKF